MSDVKEDEAIEWLVSWLGEKKQMWAINQCEEHARKVLEMLDFAPDKQEDDRE